MKIIDSVFVSLTFIVIFYIPINSFAQGFLITKSGDTIQYSKIENKGSNILYWTSEIIKKPRKIKSSEISTQIKFPEYKLSKNEIDDFTGDLKRSTELITIGSTKRDKNNYSINLAVWMNKIVYSNKKTYLIKLRTPNELGCTGSDKNYVMIKFKDGEVIKLDNDIAKIDCDRSAHSVYKLNDEALYKLRHYEIESIRYRKSDFYADYYIIFPDCLINTIKILDE